MRDPPDPGHPHDDFHLKGGGEPSVPFWHWQTNLGLCTAPACFALWARPAMRGAFGSPEPGDAWIALLAVVLLVALPIAAIGVKWRYYLRGYLVGVGLVVLYLGACTFLF